MDASSELRALSLSPITDKRVVGANFSLYQDAQSMVLLLPTSSQLRSDFLDREVGLDLLYSFCPHEICVRHGAHVN